MPRIGSYAWKGGRVSGNACVRPVPRRRESRKRVVTSAPTGKTIIAQYLGSHRDVRPEVTECADHGGRRTVADGTSGGGSSGGDHLRFKVDASVMCTKGIRPHFLSDAYFLSASLRAVRDTPKKTSLTSRAPTTRTHEPTPLCSSPPPDRPRAYLIASHDHNAGYASLRARPHASPSFHARSRSRNGPLTAAPRPFLTRPPRPTRMSGVRQDTLNATRSSNFVRFMLAYVLPALVSRLLSRACFRPRLRPRGRDDLSQNSYPQTHSCAFCSSAFSPAARPETHPFPQTLTPYPYPHPYPVPPYPVARCTK